MVVNLCHACRQVNPASALRCSACGERLSRGDTKPMPLRHDHGDDTGVLWLDDLVAPRRPAAGGPAAATAEPEALAITLREIELPSALPVLTVPVTLPAEDLVVSDPGVDPPVLRDAIGRRPAAHGPDPDPDWLAAQRAAKRAAVRRARLRGATAASGDDPSVPEVLVLDPDDAARDELCTLLRAFGFGVHSVAEAAKAAALVAARPFAAAFVDIVLDATDGGAGIDLCRTFKSTPRHPGGPPGVLVLVTARLRPIDRVRAELAGCDDTLAKPVSRGSVARVLDARGVPLPADARRL